MTKGTDRSRRRDAIHAEHALAYPASRETGDGFVAFGLLHPPHAGADRLAVAVLPHEILATRHPNLWPLRVNGPSWGPMTDGGQLIASLGMLGVGRGIGAMPIPISGEPPVVGLLAEALVRAWDEAGCLDDPEEAMFEAREREQARLDGAGLNELLAALPKGIGRILDSRGDLFGDRTWNRRFVEFALARPGRSAAIAALGDLMDLVGTERPEEDPLDDPDPPTFVLERIARWPTQPLAGSGSPSRAHAAWLLEKFSRVEPRGDLASAVPTLVLKDLVSHRDLIEDRRLRDPADAAALVDLVKAIDEGGMSHPRLSRVLHVLSLVGGDMGYGGIREAIALAGGGGAAGFRKGCERLFVDADGLRRAFRDSVLIPALVPSAIEALGPAEDTLGWLHVRGPALAATTAALADDGVFGGRTLADAAAAGLAWRQAGEPGRVGEPEIMWRDIAMFGGEATERLVAVARGAVPSGDPTPFLSHGWLGPDGADRIVAATRTIAAACLPEHRAGRSLPPAPSPEDRQAAPVEARRPGLLRRLIAAARG